MIGYYYECPSCANITPVDPKPLVWYDVERVDPETARKLLDGTIDVHAIPVYGDGRQIVGTVNRMPLPDRVCDHCGQDGCVDCIPNALCKACRQDACGDAEACTDPMKCQECPR